MGGMQLVAFYHTPVPAKPETSLVGKKKAQFACMTQVSLKLLRTGESFKSGRASEEQEEGPTNPASGPEISGSPCCL